MFRPPGPVTAVWASLLLAACVSGPTRNTGTPARAPDDVPATSPPVTLAAPPLTPSGPVDTPAPTPTAASEVAPVADLGPTTMGRVENFGEVGHHSLNGRGGNAGLALAYPCAYLGNRNISQIAIMDVSHPARPALVGELPVAPPSGRPVELRAVPDLGLLVVLNFSLDHTVLTYDVHDCRNPRPLGALALGAVPHEFFLWRDPSQPARLLLYAAMFHHLRPDLNVVDLSDPAAPRRVASWAAADEGALGTLHSLSLSRDGRRAYLALWEGGFLVADTSELAEALPDPHIRLMRDAEGFFAPAPGTNVHSAVRLSAPGYVLVTQEVYDCPFAGLFIADVADEAHPQIVSRFALPEDDPACKALPQPDAVFTSHNPLVVGPLVFVTWYGGGVQALDVSDPTRPRRVGLFVPDGEGAASQSYIGTYPVQMWSYPILREGLIYVSDIQGGLYILKYTGPGAEAVRQVPLAEGNVTVLP